MTVCIVVALRVLWRYVVRIFAKFQLPHDMVVSGRFVPGADDAGAASASDPSADARVIGRCARAPRRTPSARTARRVAERPGRACTRLTRRTARARRERAASSSESSRRRRWRGIRASSRPRRPSPPRTRRCPRRERPCGAMVPTAAAPARRACRRSATLRRTHSSPNRGRAAGSSSCSSAARLGTLRLGSKFRSQPLSHRHHDQRQPDNSQRLKRHQRRDFSDHS